MKIVVCVKQVPDTETRVQIAADGTAIVEGDVNWIVSPYDEFAIEEALRIKEAKGGEVVLVTLGPERVQRAAQRPRHGRRLGRPPQGRALDATDTLGTARALAAAIARSAPWTWC